MIDRKPPIFNDQELTKLRKFHRVTQKLDSNLAMFKDDHKMFKNRFLYSGKDQYIEVPLLLAHLSRILNTFQDESIDNLAVNSAYQQSLSEFESNTLYIKEKQLENITIDQKELITKKVAISPQAPLSVTDDNQN